MKNTTISSLVESKGFQISVMGVIFVNALLLGLETFPFAKQYDAWLRFLNWVIQVVFVIEISLRVVAHSPKPFSFFRDGWNLFDFSVVALSLLPVAGPFATVARLARLLRVVRIVSLSPDLRLIVNTMLRSIPSLFHVTLLMAVLIYVYAILGYYLYHPDDPQHWGSLGQSLLSTFQLLTLEGWNEIQAGVIETHPWSWLFFASFIIVAVFVVVNLFIAVVLNNLENVKAEQAHEADMKHPQHEILEQIQQLKEQLERLERSLKQEG